MNATSPTLRRVSVHLLTLVCIAFACGCDGDGDTTGVDGSTEIEGGMGLDASTSPLDGGADAAQDSGTTQEDASGPVGEDGGAGDGGPTDGEVSEAGADSGGGCASFEDCDDLDPATFDACDSGVCTHRTITYDDDVQAVYADHCTPCHAGAPCSGGACQVDSYAAVEQASSVCAGSTVAECTQMRTMNGSMPKGAGCTGDPALDAANPACLSAEDHRLLAAWIAADWPEN